MLLLVWNLKGGSVEELNLIDFYKKVLDNKIEIEIISKIISEENDDTIIEEILALIKQEKQNNIS